jgi:hypothetical protein
MPVWHCGEPILWRDGGWGGGGVMHWGGEGGWMVGTGPVADKCSLRRGQMLAWHCSE